MFSSNMSMFAIALALYFAGSSFAAASTWEQDTGRAVACIDSVGNDAAFSSLNAKLMFEGPPSLAQLSDGNILSAVEIEQIKLRSSRMSVCREMMRAAYQRHHPWLLSGLDLLYLQCDMVYLQLIRQRVTFGTGNRLLREASLEFSRRSEAYFQARSDEQRRQQAEENRRLADQARRLGENFDQGAGRGPVTCFWRGSMLVCT